MKLLASWSRPLLPDVLEVGVVEFVVVVVVGTVVVVVMVDPQPMAVHTVMSTPLPRPQRE